MAELSDRDLSDQLRAYGVNVGPIVATTRKFYERKLQKLIDGGGVVDDQPEEEYSQSEEEEEEPVRKYEEPKRVYPPPRSYDQPPRYNEPTPKSYDPPTTYEPLRPKSGKVSPMQTTTYTTTTVTQRTVREAMEDEQLKSKSAYTKPKPRPPANNNGGVPMWVKLIIFLVVLFFGFLVFYNMEPSAESVIPELPDDSNV
ncbi:hypothetical protein ScPMuIL_008494 [Solemya velum]